MNSVLTIRNATALASACFLIAGLVLVTFRVVILWEQPYQSGRVWQSFDLIGELERTHGVPWDTEFSGMAGGNEKARFLQEFPLMQYLAVGLRRCTNLTLAQSGQAIASLEGLTSVMIIALFAWSLPTTTPIRLTFAAAIFFIPGFLRYAIVAVPDATVFVFDAAGVALLLVGRRRRSDLLLCVGALLIGLAVLIKSTAFLPTLAVAAALFLEKRKTALLVLGIATIPGIAWALLAARINPDARPVNQFARLAALPEYWWNPRLYADPWWYRNLVFLHYDTLGLLGMTAIGVAVWIAFRRRLMFELILLSIPPIILLLVFNFHSASHGYYHLIWLPFSILVAMEVFAQQVKAERTAAVVAVVIGLALLGVAERAHGSVERLTGHAEANHPLFPARTLSNDARIEREFRALNQEFNQEHAYLAYFGDKTSSFLDSGLRGWIIASPNLASAKSQRLLESVVAQQEWRRVNKDWLQDRVRRGMRLIVVERSSKWNTPQFLDMVAGCGFEKSAVTDDKIIFQLPPKESNLNYQQPTK